MLQSKLINATVDVIQMMYIISLHTSEANSDYIITRTGSTVQQLLHLTIHHHYHHHHYSKHVEKWYLMKPLTMRSTANKIDEKINKRPYKIPHLESQ